MRMPQDDLLAAIRDAMIEIAENAEVRAELPDIGEYLRGLNEAVEPSDEEQAIARLYSRLHQAGARYSMAEKELLKKYGGYSCISGGLSPILMAGQFIGEDSVVADLGAGNGLQGLLMQRLYPHAKTLQVEISSEMLRMGRLFQRALGIRDDRIEWINDDIMNVSIEGVDFIYIYRPAKPHSGGSEMYRAIAGKLSASKRPLVVFSVADCLGSHLDKRFSVFYTDGHLTCFLRG